MLYFNGRSILLIRNPFKAIISSFVHLVFGTYSDSEFGIIAKEKAIFRKEFFKQIFIENKLGLSCAKLRSS